MNWILVILGVALLLPSMIGTILLPELIVPEGLDLVALAMIAVGAGVR